MRGVLCHLNLFSVDDVCSDVLRDAVFATPEVALGCGFSSARVCVAL